MHAERDLLVRVVFPQLKDRCARRCIHLVDIDLRWGVPDELVAGGGVLNVCLDEIEHCRPFFLGLLGERYGTVPDLSFLDPATPYTWLRNHGAGHSITAIEIFQGVLNDPGAVGRAFFYFRAPSFVAQLSDEQRKIYCEVPTDDELRDLPPQAAEACAENRRQKLSNLKSRILGMRPALAVSENYPCRWDAAALDPVEKRPGRLVGLDEFGQRVLEDLWRGITEQFPEEALERDPLVVERANHDAFAEQRLVRFYGRTDALTSLRAYAAGDDPRPCVVTGEPGSGKSTVLAALVRQLPAEMPDSLVLSHFIGASPASATLENMLRRLADELLRTLGQERKLPSDVGELGRILAELLLYCASRQRTILVVDGINQLADGGQAGAFGWFPPALPPGLRVLVGAHEGPPLDALLRRTPNLFQVMLGPLPKSTRKDIVSASFQEFRKELPDSLLELLLEKKDAGNPLFLKVACEELRLHGDHLIADKVRDLKDSLPELFNAVLDRIELDHGKEIVTRAFEYLACAPHGLLETELLDLLRPADKLQLPRVIWARLYHSLRPYLSAGEGAEGLITFFHNQFKEAVEHRYTTDVNVRRATHATLSTYFLGKGDPHGDGTWRGNDPRGRTEFPLHFLRSEPKPETLDRLFASEVPVEVCRRLCTLAALQTVPEILRRAFLASRETAWRSASAGYLILSRMDITKGASELAKTLRETPLLGTLFHRPRMTVAKHWTLFLTTLEMWLLQRPDRSIMDPLHTAWKDKLANVPLLGRMLRWRYGRRFLAWLTAWVGSVILRKVPDIWPNNAQELNCSFGKPVPELKAAVDLLRDSLRGGIQARDEDTLAKLAESRDTLTALLLHNILNAAAVKQPELVAAIAQRLFDRCMRSERGQIPGAAQLMLFVMDRFLQGMDKERVDGRYYAQFEAMLSAYLDRDERYYSCRVEGRTYKATHIAALLVQHRKWKGAGLPPLYTKVLANASKMDTPKGDLLRADLLQDIEIVGVSTNNTSLALEALRPIVDAGWWKNTDECQVILRRIVEGIGRRFPKLLEDEMSGWPLTGKAISMAGASEENPFQTLFFAIDREVLQQKALREPITSALERGIAQRSLRAFIAAYLLNLLALFDSERYGNA